MSVETEIQSLTAAVQVLCTEAAAAIATANAVRAEAQTAAAAIDIKVFPAKDDAIAYSAAHPLAIVFSEEP